MSVSASDLYPLADALQMNLLYTKDSITEEHHEKRTYQVSSFEMKLDSKILASGIDKYAAWVLLAVKGNLHILMIQNLKQKSVDAVIVDGGVVPTKKEALEKINGQSAMTAISALWDGFKRAYTLKNNGKKWDKRDINDLVDDGQAGKAGSSSSPSVPEGGAEATGF